MNKILFLVFLVNLCVVKMAIGQVTNNQREIEMDAEKFVIIANKSDATKIPDSINIILQKFAFANKLWEPGVLKNAVMLKPLFNSKLSIEERLYAADYLIFLYRDPTSLVPLTLIKNIKSSLISTPK